MRPIALAWLLLAAACARHGESREGAVLVTADLAFRPAADGEPFTFELASGIESWQAAFDEHHADGTPNRDPKPARITIEYDRILSERPFDVSIIRSADRESLARALAAVGSDVPPGRRVLIERESAWWVLRLVDTNAGFVLEEGAVAKITEPGPDGERSVALFFTDPDAKRFEDLTREHVGRRISMVSGDESLMTPQVNEAVPGGVVWIHPGDRTPEDTLARLVQ
jgi:hypothetical protein